MKLEEHTDLRLGGELITLRPTLRCGLRLERRPGSFVVLIEDLQGGSLTAALAVIRTQHDHLALGARIMDAGIEPLCAKLVDFVLQCAGIDPEAQSQGQNGPPVSFGEHLQHLYRIATGWLGWTPEVALDATPAEIMEAYKGRIEMLKAIFGGDSDKPQTRKPISTDRIRDAFHDIRTTVVKRRRRG